MMYVLNLNSINKILHKKKKKVFEICHLSLLSICYDKFNTLLLK